MNEKLKTVLGEDVFMSVVNGVKAAEGESHHSHARRVGFAIRKAACEKLKNEGLRNREIAERTGLTEGSVRFVLK